MNHIEISSHLWFYAYCAISEISNVYIFRLWLILGATRDRARMEPTFARWKLISVTVDNVGVWAKSFNRNETERRAFSIIWNITFASSVIDLIGCVSIASLENVSQTENRNSHLIFCREMLRRIQWRHSRQMSRGNVNATQSKRNYSFLSVSRERPECEHKVTGLQCTYRKLQKCCKFCLTANNPIYT